MYVLIDYQFHINQGNFDLPSSTWHEIKVEFIMLTKYAVSEPTVMTILQLRRIPKYIEIISDMLLPKGCGDDLYNCSFCQICLLY